MAQNYERWKLHTYLEVTKPVSHIDIKLELKVDLNEHGHDQKITTILILRYATGKEIITTLDMAIPRSELLKLDAKLNVTLPSFNPMIFTIKIDEKKPREYDVSRLNNEAFFKKINWNALFFLGGRDGRLVQRS